MAACLRQGRPFLDELVRARHGKIRCGIGVEASEATARRMPLRGRPLLAWVESRPWELIFARLGFPVGQPQSAPHLLTGDVVHTIDPAALESLILAGSVLTPGAVRGLLEMGWGERIGVKEVRPAAPGVNEYFTADPLNGAYGQARLQVRQYGNLFGAHTYVLTATANERPLSRWVVGCHHNGPGIGNRRPGTGRWVPHRPAAFEIQSIGPAQLQLARREQWPGCSSGSAARR